jgi:FKBP-type peptidyl-prolyl cis-trans isomerase FklB
MRQIISTIIALVISTALLAQNQQKPATTAATSTKPPAAIKLASESDSSQYILGAYLGQFLNANGIAISKPDIFLKGMDDVLSNKKLLVNADSVPKMMNVLMSKMVMERNMALEKQLFANVKGQPGIGAFPDGVCYAIVKAGTGIRPLLNDSISIHVKGYLPEGKIFEDTYSGNKPLKTTAANLIPGLKESIQIMPSGSLWRIYIPSSLAYGDKGVTGAIPPYSAVVFDIELLTILK